MSDLRKAAEMAVEALEHFNQGNSPAVLQGEFDDEIEALRQALAEEALDRMVAENQRLGLYDDLQTAIEKGTKAWADVPNASEWVEELRGNDTPQVTTEVTTEVPCKTHPDAPHGFDRNASHSADRYVCECEGWGPPEQKTLYMDMSQAPTGMPNWKPGMVVPAAKREWVGLTDDEIAKYWGDAFAGNTQYVQKFAKIIEAKLKEKNVPQP